MLRTLLVPKCRYCKSRDYMWEQYGRFQCAKCQKIARKLENAGLTKKEIISIITK